MRGLGLKVALFLLSCAIAAAVWIPFPQTRAADLTSPPSPAMVSVGASARPSQGLLQTDFKDIQHPVNLWTYAWMLAATEDEARLSNHAQIREQIPLLIHQLSAYRVKNSRTTGYAPYVGENRFALKYFDDNAWVGLDLMGAYHLTQNPNDLNQAVSVFDYVITGWDASRGGIFWNDLRRTRNTPSNAPAAELAMSLYFATHQASYLHWGMRIVNWENQHLVDPRTGAVWDLVTRRGKISRHIYSYNLGTVIGANAMVYHATGNSGYLRAAERSANFAYRWIPHERVYRCTTAFDGVLADNLQLLYQINHDPRIVHLLTLLDQSRATLRFPIRPLLNHSGVMRIQATRQALVRHGGFQAFQL